MNRISPTPPSASPSSPAAIEPARDLEREGVAALHEVDDTQFAEPDVAFAGERQLPGDADAAERGAVLGVAVGEGEAAVVVGDDVRVVAGDADVAQRQLAAGVAAHDEREAAGVVALAAVADGAGAQDDAAVGDELGLELFAQALVGGAIAHELGELFGRARQRHLGALADGLECAIALAAGQRQLVLLEGVVDARVALAARLLAGEDVFQALDVAAFLVGLGGGELVADELVALAGGGVVADVDEQLRGVAHDDALGIADDGGGAGPVEQGAGDAAARLVALDVVVVGPADGGAQLVQLGGGGGRALGAQEVHLGDFDALAGEGVGARGFGVVAGRLGRDGAPEVRREHALEEGHGGLERV